MTHWSDENGLFLRAHAASNRTPNGHYSLLSVSPNDWRTIRMTLATEGKDIANEPKIRGTPICMESWLPDGVMAVEDKIDHVIVLVRLYHTTP